MAGSKLLPGLCLLLGMLLCASSAAETASSLPQKIEAASYDFFVLDLMWPGSRCQPDCYGRPTCCVSPLIDPPEPTFLVETMATYNSISGKPVSKCSCNCRFLINPLSDMIEDLYAHWPSLSCPPQNGMAIWKSAWCNYGNCTSFNETIYFDRALKMRARVDPLITLGESGIIPSDKKTYSLADVEDALVGKLGFSTVVECVVEWGVQGKEYWLSRIRVCVSSDGKSLIVCPISRKSNCGENIWFLPFSDDMLGRGRRVVDAADHIKLPSDKAMTQ